MRVELLEQVSRARFLEDQGLQYAYLLSVFRFTIQAASYAAFEALSLSGDTPPQMQEQALRLLQPSDGDFVATLDLCIPALRQIWPGCCAAWFDNAGSSFQSSGRLMCQEIISKRNDRIGHGVLDQRTLAEELLTLPGRIEALIDIVADLLPYFAAGGGDSLCAVLDVPGWRQVPVKPLRRQGGALVLLRRIENRGSVWRLRGQTVDPSHSLPVVIELADDCRVLVELRGKQTELVARSVQVGRITWHTSVLLPLRQTQTFQGRSEEIATLMDWWLDMDSRACLVYGDGGIGKTTLVLEFLNEMLESPPPDIEWKPELIFFYSAKLTRWGVSGLEQIGGVSANVNEAIRSLARLVEAPLSREWYTEDSRSLISRAANLFQEVGLNRDSILLVIDNTETLARTSTEEAGLGKVLRELSTKVGKLLITSRRRERLEATQVQVPPMPEDVGSLLLEKLGESYGARAIQQAGDARRRKVCRQFGGKPILLDVLARHVANTNCGIDEAAGAILSQERGDLGAFLFEDAWKRMEPAYREVFLALGQLGGSVGEQMLNWACAEFACYAPNWLSAFEETRFGTLVDYGPHFDITLDAGAREFLSAKFQGLAGTERHRISTSVGHVRKKHFEATSAAEEKISDRVASAFRTNAAKAAKLAAQRRDVDGAVQWYEEATLVDPANAALFDRFAWYLMVNDRLDKAVGVARRAVELDSGDADANFTLGMIEARRAEVDSADRALLLAGKLGKPGHLVELQRARARLERAVVCKAEKPEEALELALAAVKLLESAKEPEVGRNYRHEAERTKLLLRASGVAETVRPVRTLSKTK